MNTNTNNNTTFNFNLDSDYNDYDNDDYKCPNDWLNPIPDWDLKPTFNLPDITKEDNDNNYDSKTDNDKTDNNYDSKTDNNYVVNHNDNDDDSYSECSNSSLLSDYYYECDRGDKYKDKYNKKCNKLSKLNKEFSLKLDDYENELYEQEQIIKEQQEKIKELEQVNINWYDQIWYWYNYSCHLQNQQNLSTQNLNELNEEIKRKELIIKKKNKKITKLKYIKNKKNTKNILLENGMKKIGNILENSNNNNNNLKKYHMKKKYIRYFNACVLEKFNELNGVFKSSKYNNLRELLKNMYEQYLEVSNFNMNTCELLLLNYIKFCHNEVRDIWRDELTISYNNELSWGGLHELMTNTLNNSEWVNTVEFS